MEPMEVHLASELPVSSLFDALFEEAAVGLCLVSPDGHVLRANQNWLRITGVSADDALGAPFLDLVARDRDGARRALERARRGEVVAVPRRLVRVDDRETFLEGRMSPVAARDGTAVLVALRDVTSEVTFQIRALEALPNLVWASQADGFYDYLSPQWLEYTGVPFERQAGSGWLEQVHPADRERATSAWARALASSARYDVEYRLRRSDGVHRWHMARGAPLRDHSGRVQRWLGTATDIHDRKLAEERIASLQRVTAAFAPALTQAEVARVLFEETVALFGVEVGQVRRVAPDGELELIYQCGCGESDGAPPKVVARASALPSAVAARTAAPVFVQTGAELEAQHPDLSPLRERLGVGAWAALPLVVHGAVVGVAGLGWRRARAFPPDEREFMISLGGQCAQAFECARLYDAERAARERAQAAEEEARRIGNLQERLLAVVGHDLRTPLQAVTLGAKVLFLRGGLSEQQAATLARVSSSAARMNGIIRDLLDFTRARQGAGIAVTRQRMDLGETCRRAILELQEVHPDRSVALDAAGDLALDGDPERMLQVVSNLVGNALQYGPAAAPVQVTVRSEADAVRIVVHNGGPPIPPDLLPTLFEPFRRGHKADGDERSGSVGLGLFIVHEIVRAHGGSVEVRSTAEKGTTFTVTLPRS